MTRVYGCECDSLCSAHTLCHKTSPVCGFFPSYTVCTHMCGQIVLVPAVKRDCSVYISKSAMYIMLWPSVGGGGEINTV